MLKFQAFYYVSSAVLTCRLVLSLYLRQLLYSQKRLLFSSEAHGKMWITYHSISIPYGLYALCCCAVKGLIAAIQTLMSLVSSRLDDPGSFYQEKNPLSFKVIFRNQWRNFLLKKYVAIFCQCISLSYRKLSKLIWELFSAPRRSHKRRELFR